MKKEKGKFAVAKPIVVEYYPAHGSKYNYDMFKNDYEKFPEWLKKEYELGRFKYIPNEAYGKKYYFSSKIIQRPAGWEPKIINIDVLGCPYLVKRPGHIVEIMSNSEFHETYNKKLLSGVK